MLELIPNLHTKMRHYILIYSDSEGNCTAELYLVTANIHNAHTHTITQSCGSKVVGHNIC